MGRGWSKETQCRWQSEPGLGLHRVIVGTRDTEVQQVFCDQLPKLSSRERGRGPAVRVELIVLLRQDEVCPWELKNLNRLEDG